jgi:hypothetical protein
MVTQSRALLALIVLPFALILACDKVPLLAPTGAVISLLPQTTTVSLNSEITIIATVIENGQSAAPDHAGRRGHAGAERHAHNLYDDAGPH